MYLIDHVNNENNFCKSYFPLLTRQHHHHHIFYVLFLYICCLNMGSIKLFLIIVGLHIMKLIKKTLNRTNLLLKD